MGERNFGMLACSQIWNQTKVNMCLNLLLNLTKKKKKKWKLTNFEQQKFLGDGGTVVNVGRNLCKSLQYSQNTSRKFFIKAGGQLMTLVILLPSVNKVSLPAVIWGESDCRIGDGERCGQRIARVIDIAIPFWCCRSKRSNNNALPNSNQLTGNTV